MPETQPPARNRKRGRPRSSGSASNTAPVLALERGLRLLETLAGLQQATLGELATRLDMPPSTAHRLLATLQAHGFAEFDSAAQVWGVGIGAYRIGAGYLQRASLVETAQRTLRRLMAETGETANLGIPEDGYVVFVSQVETPNPIRALFRAGSRSRMHASGIGKALLAHMPERAVTRLLARHGLEGFTPNTRTTPEALRADLAETATRGWAFDDEERHIGMRCIAAPVFNAQGEAVAGISVSGPTARFTPETIARTGPLLRDAAARLTRLTGGVCARTP